MRGRSSGTSIHTLVDSPHLAGAQGLLMSEALDALGGVDGALDLIGKRMRQRQAFSELVAEDGRDALELSAAGFDAVCDDSRFESDAGSCSSRPMPHLPSLRPQWLAVARLRNSQRERLWPNWPSEECRPRPSLSAIGHFEVRTIGGAARRIRPRM